MIDFSKVTDNEVIINLLKQRENINAQIRKIDEMALIRYELEALNEDDVCVNDEHIINEIKEDLDCRI